MGEHCEGDARDFRVQQQPVTPWPAPQQMNLSSAPKVREGGVRGKGGGGGGCERFIKPQPRSLLVRSSSPTPKPHENRTVSIVTYNLK